MTDENPDIRARRAKQILEDPLFAEAKTELEQYLFEQWKLTASEDLDRRENIYYVLQGAEHFHQQISRIIGEGSVARQAGDTHLKKPRVRIRA
tara:strand:- start:1547 stop:1825 length:279 start_codon:yes stop_codon:yes gene_type:complete